MLDVSLTDLKVCVSRTSNASGNHMFLSASNCRIHYRNKDKCNLCLGCVIVYCSYLQNMDCKMFIWQKRTKNVKKQMCNKHLTWANCDVVIVIKKNILRVNTRKTQRIGRSQSLKVCYSRFFIKVLLWRLLLSYSRFFRRAF